MVAIVAGNGLGLFNTSANVLGSAGILGQGWLGQAGGRSYVNAATGNLVLQFREEQLSGRGADLAHLRTYNSLGTWVDGRGAHGWRLDGECTVKLRSGSLNVAGSTVSRTAEDGSQTTFTHDGIRYVSTDGSGAHDTLEYNPSAAATQRWTYTEGSTRVVERYGTSTVNNQWQLSSRTDSSGNLVLFEYTSGRLARIKDQGSNQKIEFTYTGDNSPRLWTVTTSSLTVDGNGRATSTLGSAIQQVEYTYFGDGRLQTVTIDLTPNDATDSVFYTTTYTYEGTSDRVTSVVQSDGTRLDIEYYSDATHRVKWVKDANGKQTFNYVSSTQTDIVISALDGANPQTWSYTYDSTTRQLAKIESPAVNGARLTTMFTYETNEVDGQGHAGNLKTITQVMPGGTNRTVTYGYDSRGNRILERDTLGNTITRTFGATHNQVLSETRYKTADPDGAGAQLPDPAGAMATRFVYDSQARLRFVVSAEGRVIENRYGSPTVGFGLLERTIQYTVDRYTAQTASESDLIAWAADAARDKTKTQLTQYTYDLRGNLATSTDYATVSSNGSGVSDAATTVTEHIYDGHGQLLKTLAIRGSNRNLRVEQTSFAYDGLGREVARTTAGGTQTTAYNGGERKIQVTTTTGLVETRTFDDRGNLVSVSRAGNSTTRATRYFYDAQGRLALTLDALGGRRFSFYDAAGRLAYRVNATGEVTGFTYNAAGQLLTETHYKNVVGSTNSWLDDALNPTRVTRTTFVVAAAAGDGVDLVTVPDVDRTIAYTYDDAGRLRTRADDIGPVTTTSYDAASRLTQQQTGERITRYFYDRDGRQVGVVDPLGYLTESKFDGAGNLVETVRYLTRSPNAADVSSPVWVGVANQTAIGGREFVYHLPAFDPDGDALTFSPQGTWPSWLTLETTSTGVTLRGVPPTNKNDNQVNVVVRASDNRNTERSNVDVTVRITVKNSPPSWVALADAKVAADASSFSLTLPAATDLESTAAQLVYSISGLPEGLKFAANTRIISRDTTRPLVAGTYTVTARVADGTGDQALFTERTFVVQVTDKGPTWPAVSNQTMVRGDALSFNLPAATDFDGHPITYRLRSAPAWLTLTMNGATASLSGTPPTTAPAALQQVVVEAEDSFGEVSLLSFSVDVRNHAPRWQGAFAMPVQTGTALNLQLGSLATDPEGSAIQYEAVSGLPAGLHITTDGRITGTCSVIGTFAVTVRATDGSDSSDTTLTLTTLNAPPRETGTFHPLDFEFDSPPTDSPPSEGRANIIVMAPFVDPNNDTMTYTASLPGWMTFASSSSQGGTLQFQGDIPRNRRTDAPPFHAWIEARDSRGGVTRVAFDVIVRKTLGLPGAVGMTQAVAADAVAADAAGVQAAALQAIMPIEDVLSAWRPATTESDLHSHRYYDGQGRVIGMVDERGFLTAMVYDEQANTRQTVQYETAVTVSDTDTLDDLKTDGGTSRTSTIEYTDRGLVNRSIDRFGTVTRFEYDAAGRLVRQVAAAGQTDASGNSEERATRTTYNAFGEVTGTLGGAGDAWLAADNTRTLDQAIRTRGTRYEYDQLGRRVRSFAANGVNDAGNATLFYYDSEGSLTHAVNARGEVSETVYNSFGQVDTVRNYGTRLIPALVADLRSGAKGFTDLVAALATLPTTRNAETKYEYDRRGLVTKLTDAERFATDRTYDIYGQLATQIRSIVKGPGNTAAVTTTTQFDYDLVGRLLSTTSDLNGLNFNTQTVYDAFGRVAQSVDAAGKVTITRYQDSGRTIEVEDPLNRKVRTTYDAFARVTLVVDARGETTTYSYDDSARSMTLTTPEGFSVTTTRTRHGETSSVTDGRGNTVRYEYNRDGQLTRVIDPLNNVVTRNVYDDAGRVFQTIDARNVVTQFAYDAVRRIAERRIDPEGLNLAIDYEINALGRRIGVIEGVGDNRGSNVVRVTTYKYDLNGRLTDEIRDEEGLGLTTHYSYDGLGEMIKVERGDLENPNQQVTLYFFNKAGQRVKEVAAPSSVFGPESSRTRDLTTEYRYDAAGRVSRRIDANGQSTRYVYDAAGQLTHTVDAQGQVSRSFYDASGRVVRTHRYAVLLTSTVLAGLRDVVSDPTTVTPAANANDQRSYFIYDKDGRQRFSLQNALGTNWTVSENRYDANGNVTEARRYEKFLADSLVTAIDADSKITVDEVKAELRTRGYREVALGSDTTVESTLSKTERTRHAYDANNRLRFTVDALGSIAENVYDNVGNIVTTMRFATRPTLSVFDESTINGAVDRGNVANQVSRFAYDKAGRLRFKVQQIASGVQRVIESRYDAVGRVVETRVYANIIGALGDYIEDTVADAVNPSALDSRTGYAYDAAGRQVYVARVLSTTDAGVMSGLVARRVYDSVDQLTQTTAYASDTIAFADFGKATLDAAISGRENPAEDRTTSFVYDKAGRQRFVVRADGSFSEMVYDSLGQVTERRDFDVTVKATAPRTEAFLAGRRASRAVGDGATRGEKYTYDKVGRVLTATDAASKVETWTYDAFGHRKTYVDKNNAQWTYTYDRVGRPRTQVSPSLVLQLSDETTAGAARTLTTQFDYDAFGNLTRRTDAPGTAEARITEYEYDLVNRQKMIKLPAVTMQVGAETGPTSRILVTLLDYDTFGNLKKRTEASATADARETSYEYDCLGRQTKATLPGWYDPQTRKVDAQAAGRFQRTLESTYDAFDAVIRTAVRTGPGSGDLQYEYKVYDALGRLKFDVDGLKNVTAFGYSVFGDQTQVTRYSVSVGNPLSNNLWTSTDLVVAIGNDGDTRAVTTAYDTMGRKTQVTSPAFRDNYYAGSAAVAKNAASIVPPGTAVSPVTTFQYDAFGKLIHEALQIDNVSVDGANRVGHWRDTWHYFDVMGREKYSIDAGGFHTARTYDANGNLKQVIEYANAGSKGSSLTTTAPAPPAENSKDRITEFDYDALNRQTAVKRYGLSYFDTATASMVTNARNVPVTVASIVYDSMGNVRRRVDASSNVTITDYNKLGQVTKVTDPGRLTAKANETDPFNGRVTASPTTTFTLNAFGQVIKQVRAPGGGAGSFLVTLNRYDAAGNLIATTDAKRVTTDSTGNVTSVNTFYDKVRGYDYAGRLIREEQRLDLLLGSWKTVPQTIMRKYAYDAAGRMTDSVDLYTEFRDDGTPTTVASQGGVRRLYNAFGEVQQEQRIAGAAGIDPKDLTGTIVALYTYDQTGHIATKIAGDGLTRYFYDLAGQMTRQEQVDNNNSNDGLVGGLLATRIAETGYDVLGRAVVQRLPFFTTDATTESASPVPITPITQQFLDRWGNALTRRQGDFVGQYVNTSERRETSYSYNHDNQVILESFSTTPAVRADGTSYSANVSHEIRYDRLGRAVQERDLVDDAATGTVEANLLRQRDKRYDAAGQLSSETDAAGFVTEYAYDAYGNRVGTRNARGSVFVGAFDKNGNLTSYSVLRKNTAGLEDEYRSGVDAASSLAAVTLNRYQYDQANRRIASGEALNDASQTVYWTYINYDERGLVREKRLPHVNSFGTDVGILTKYAYDAFGNRTREQDGMNNVRRWTYSTSDYRIGQLTGCVAGGSTTGYVYDDFGQRWTETRGSSARTFEYYENGLLKRLTSNTSLGVQGDAGGADYWRATDVSNYSYSANGERVRESFARTGEQEVDDLETGHVALEPIADTTRSTTSSYDARGRIAFFETSDHTTLQLHYAYDELGNRRSIVADYHRSSDAQSQHTEQWYTYDAEGRMLIVDGVMQSGQIIIGEKGTALTYDELGRRRTSFRHESFRPEDRKQAAVSFLDNNNQVVRLETSWDQDRAEQYSYNDLNQLIKVEQQLAQSAKTRQRYLSGSFTGPAENLANFQTGFVVTNTRHYELRGTMDGSTTYADLHFIDTDLSANFTATAAQARAIVAASYRRDGQLYFQHTLDQGTDSHHAERDSILSKSYDAAGMLDAYSYRQGANTNGEFTNTYDYTYIQDTDGYKESRIDVDFTKPGTSDIPQHNVGSTQNGYDAAGQLIRQKIVNDAQFRRRDFIYDSDGHIINTAEQVRNPGAALQSGSADNFYASGREVAMLGTGSLLGAQFSNGYTPISAAYPGIAPGNYVVTLGDTLAGIARTLFGDAQLWYLIADANHVTYGPDQALPSSEIGKSYRIPNVVTPSHNNSETFQPYNAARIIGDSTPSPALPVPLQQCTGIAAVIATAIIMVVERVVARGVTAMLAPLGPVGFVAGKMAGNAAGQFMAIALGMRDSFSGRDLLAAGLTAAVAQAASAAQGQSDFPADPVGAFAGSIGIFIADQAANDLSGGGTPSIPGLIYQFASTALGRTFEASSAITPSYFTTNDFDTRDDHGWAGALAGMADQAFNPDTGWVFNSQHRNWSTIIGQALGTTINTAISELSKRETVLEADRAKQMRLRQLQQLQAGSSNGEASEAVAQSFAETNAGTDASSSEQDASGSPDAGYTSGKDIAIDDYLGPDGLDDESVIHAWQSDNGTAEGTYWSADAENRDPNRVIGNYRYTLRGSDGVYAEVDSETGVAYYPEALVIDAGPSPEERAHWRYVGELYERWGKLKEFQTFNRGLSAAPHLAEDLETFGISDNDLQILRRDPEVNSRLDYLDRKAMRPINYEFGPFRQGTSRDKEGREYTATERKDIALRKMAMAGLNAGQIGLAGMAAGLGVEFRGHLDGLSQPEIAALQLEAMERVAPLDNFIGAVGDARQQARTTGLNMKQQFETEAFVAGLPGRGRVSALPDQPAPTLPGPRGQDQWMWQSSGAKAKFPDGQVRPVDYMVVRNNYTFTYATETDFVHVQRLALDLAGGGDGVVVYVGSGGHGTLKGSFLTQPELRERRFLEEDRAGINNHTIQYSSQMANVVRVLDLNDPHQRAAFERAEGLAASDPNSKIRTVRAYCYSVLDGPLGD